MRTNSKWSQRERVGQEVVEWDSDVASTTPWPARLRGQRDSVASTIPWSARLRGQRSVCQATLLHSPPPPRTLPRQSPEPRSPRKFTSTSPAALQVCPGKPRAQKERSFGWDGRSRALNPEKMSGEGVSESEPWLGPRGAAAPQAGGLCCTRAQLTWLACPGPWAASRALYSPSDISTRKPVTPSRGWAPWISGSAMIGLDLAVLRGREWRGELGVEWPPGDIYSKERLHPST